MPGRRALLLDFDGTVVDSLGQIYACLDQTARKHLGTPFPRQLWEAHMGRPLVDTFALLGAEAVPHTDVMIQSYRAFQEQSLDQVQAFAGVPEALRLLRRHGVKLAIVTTKLRRTACRQLATLGLESCFDVVIGFDNCTSAKPDPEPFERALRALGVEPAMAVAVGDTPLDIAGARAAGIMAVGALWCGVGIQELLAASPDRTIEHPQQLVALAET